MKLNFPGPATMSIHPSSCYAPSVAGWLAVSVARLPPQNQISNVPLFILKYKNFCLKPIV